MKTKLAAICFAASISATALAQGTIYFNNRTATGDAFVRRPDGTGAGAGITAGLFLVGAGGLLTPLFPTTTFRESPAAATFFVHPVSVIVPGIPAGSPGTVRMRMWETSAGSYEAARAGIGGIWWGESNDVTLQQLGGIPPGAGDPIPDASLNGLLIGMLIPEPSTLSLLSLLALATFSKRPS